MNHSYVRGCAVHKTFNRACTIHATSYLTVERNVVYDNMGHAIFTEDGIEENNVIQYNLAIFTQTSSSLLNVDITPSSYWVCKAILYVINNAQDIFSKNLTAILLVAKNNNQFDL